MMTWGEFKKAVEAEKVTDDMEIEYIDVYEEIEVVIVDVDQEKNSFTVSG